MSDTNPFFLFPLIVVWLSTSLNRIIARSLLHMLPFQQKKGTFFLPLHGDGITESG